MRLDSWIAEISLIAAAAVVFISTDIDDLALLAGWFSDRTFRTSHILLGQLLGIGALVAIGVALGLMGFFLPRPALGALGVLPIGIGVLRLMRPQSESDEGMVGSATTSILSVASVTVAHGSDNLAVYVPFFAAARTVFDIATIVVVFLVMTVAWVALARWFARHPVWGASLQRWGRRVVPWLLVLLGAGIIYEAGSIAWLMEGALSSAPRLRP
ncbi:MAG TPA: cadmium resistance transporter [Roseiarcus sp.]|jgi:cadmium resistance protein CadD (predicted permease)